MKRFDLIIIGGGPAGYLAAERAAAGGIRAALFEARALGGVCLNEGCIPTKTMLHSARIFDGASRGKAYGVQADNLSLDHAAVLKRKDKVVKILTSGIASKMRSLGVTIVPARAFVTGRTGGGFAVRDGEEEYEAERLLIASGSKPITPPIDGLAAGLESGFVITSREALELKNTPGSLVIIGGGVIGLEMACYFAAAGASVTVVEMLDKIAGPLEPEISKILLGNLQKKGINFKLGCKVTGITPDGVTINSLSGEETLPAGKVLMSIGRAPSTDGLGLENVGVLLSRGAVVTDERLRTNIPGVWAAGDVNGRSMLAHTAYREAEAAVSDMLGRDDAVDYDAIPSVIYTAPEVACVGETEESAAAKGIAAKTVKLSMRYSGRYLAENEGGDGICKLVAAEDGSRVLGVHIIGGCASEIILAASMMIACRLPVSELRKVVFPHPTAGEIIREALFAL